MGDKPDYYELLGVDPSATVAEIKAGYRAKVQRHHRDHGGDDVIFRLLTVARDTLLDPDKRREYDQRDSEQRAASQPPVGAVVVPHLVGFSVERAESELGGLDVVVDAQPVRVPNGDSKHLTVVGQSPPPGTMTAPGGTIVVQIAVQEASWGEITGMLASQLGDFVRSEYRKRREARAKEAQRRAAAQEREAAARWRTMDRLALEPLWLYPAIYCEGCRGWHWAWTHKGVVYGDDTKGDHHVVPRSRCGACGAPYAFSRERLSFGSPWGNYSCGTCGAEVFEVSVRNQEGSRPHPRKRPVEATPIEDARWLLQFVRCESCKKRHRSWVAAGGMYGVSRKQTHQVSTISCRSCRHRFVPTNLLPGDEQPCPSCGRVVFSVDWKNNLAPPPSPPYPDLVAPSGRLTRRLAAALVVVPALLVLVWFGATREQPSDQATNVTPQTEADTSTTTYPSTPPPPSTGATTIPMPAPTSTPEAAPIVLPPANVPSEVPICSGPATFDGRGYPTGTCEDEPGLSSAAWTRMATDFPSIIALGPDPTPANLKAAICDAWQQDEGSFSSISTALATAAAYYGWGDAIASDGYEQLSNPDCPPAAAPSTNPAGIVTTTMAF